MNNPLKVLIIDDDKVDAITIVRSIKKSDIIADMDSAYSAKEGFEKLALQSYDLIFLDYMMPDLDGISILNKLRENGVETPVIFITSQGDEKIASQAILAGASDYMLKTLLSSDAIAHSIRTALKLHENQVLRKQAELELKLNSSRLSEAQKLAKIGSWEVNLINGDVYFSEELFNILEIDKSIKPSIDLFKSCLVSEKDSVLFDKKLSAVQHNVQREWFSHTILGKQGTTKYINEYIKCLTDENNRPLKVLGTVQDVSIQKEIEQELIDAKNLAEESVKLKERFLTNMSHEIRTPMNGVVGFAKILEETALDENQLQSVLAIRTAGENLMTIINDILDLSKIEADKMVFESIPFSISKTVNSVVELIGASAKGKNVIISSSIPDGLSDYLIGDPTRLSQILINLTGNALKFTNKGNVTVALEEKRLSGDVIQIQFSISDTGIGIPEDKLDSIFESFNQASNETTRKYGGTGLGLTITKKLVELQGGEISVESEMDKGSVFKFTLPFIKNNSSAIDNKNTANKQLDPSFLKDLKILLVEDNELNQLLTVKLFKKWNKEIDVAENGLIAIEKVLNNYYDIILMDIQMPEMDGNEVTKYIREKLPNDKSQVPIIAMTAHATADEEKNCLRNGMNDYLSKPFDFNVLLEKLFDNLELSQQHILNQIVITEDRKTESLVNFDYLIDFSDNDVEFIQEVIELFLESAPQSIEDISNYAAQKDDDNLKKEVHKFKSSISILKIQEAIDYIAIIENELLKNPQGTARYEAVPKLKAICDEVITELRTRTVYI